MPLVKDFATFARYVKYNFTSEDINSLLDTGPAERKYILPLLGATIYNGLLAQVAANAITQPALLDVVRAAVVPLTVYNNLAVLQTQLGDTGMRTLFSDNTQAAHRWEFNEVKDYLEDKGCEGLDQLIVHLYENKVALAWTAPDTMGLVFKTGSEFTKFYALKYPHRTFLTLAELVNEVQDQYIGATIGDAFLKEIMEKADPNADEKEAISFIKKSVANLTAMKAIEKKPVRITSEGLFVMIAGSSSDDKNAKAQTASIAQLHVQRDAVERDGDSYLQRLKMFLDSKAAADKFITYFNSSYYTAPTTVVVDRNESRKTYGF